MIKASILAEKNEQSKIIMILRTNSLSLTLQVVSTERIFHANYWIKLIVYLFVILYNQKFEVRRKLLEKDK